MKHNAYRSFPNIGNKFAKYIFRNKTKLYINCYNYMNKQLELVNIH